MYRELSGGRWGEEIGEEIAVLCVLFHLVLSLDGTRHFVRIYSFFSPCFLSHTIIFCVGGMRQRCIFIGAH